jgi:hypothetical protein
MIDPALLRQLGWRDDLINEVNRVASNLRNTAARLNDITNDTHGVVIVESRTSLNCDNAAVNSVATPSVRALLR